MGGFERAPVTECRSRIDGKLIRVRHADEGDVLFIRKKMEASGNDLEAIDYADWVVAEEDGALLGCGTMRKVPSGGKSFSVYVEERQEYLVGMMVKHIVENPR